MSGFIWHHTVRDRQWRSDNHLDTMLRLTFRPRSIQIALCSAPSRRPRQPILLRRARPNAAWRRYPRIDDATGGSARLRPRGSDRARPRGVALTTSDRHRLVGSFGFQPPPPSPSLGQESPRLRRFGNSLTRRSLRSINSRRLTIQESERGCDPYGRASANFCRLC